MVAGLSPSDVVRVDITFSPVPVQERDFGAALKLGSTEGVIDVAERIRRYTTIDGVVEDYGTAAPEYLAALTHFSQSPQPVELYLGRFAQVATKGVLHGATLTPTQQLMSNFQSVANGAMELLVNGVPTALTGLNFSTTVNLNGVAAVLDAALTGATVVWNASYGRFDVYTNAGGAGQSVGFALPPVAVGSVAYVTNPPANSTLTPNGTTVTIVASAPVGNQVLQGASLAATLQNLVTFLSGSTDPQLVKFRYSLAGTSLELVAAAPGPGGNALTLAASAGTVSGPTLSGGTGTDVSALLGLSQASGALTPVNGVAAESAATAVAACADMSTGWYNVEFALASPLLLPDVEAVGQLVEALSPSRIYSYTATTTDVLVPDVSSDVASVLKSLNLSRTLTQYSSNNAYASASLFARISTVDWDAANTALTLKFKQEPGVVAETVTETQAAALKAKNCNVFVNYRNGAAILQEGVMCDGSYIDERVGLDWLQDALQTDLFDLLLAALKVPQTDAGNHLLKVQADATLQRGVNNGLIAGGKWTGPSFGSLKTNDALPAGYYTFIDLVANQSDADRAARKSQPIQVAVKLAGAIHSVDVLVTVNR